MGACRGSRALGWDSGRAKGFCRLLRESIFDSNGGGESDVATWMAAWGWDL